MKQINFCETWKISIDLGTSVCPSFRLSSRLLLERSLSSDQIVKRAWADRKYALNKKRDIINISIATNNA